MVFYRGGEDESILKSKYRELELTDSVVFVGFSSNPYSYMSACDVYVQPSRYEGYAVTLMEAIVLKKVIVTTNVSGSEEAVDNGQNGLIVRHDVDEIGHAIMDIWTTPNKIQEMQAYANQKLLVQQESEDMLKGLLNV